MPLLSGFANRTLYPAPAVEVPPPPPPLLETALETATGDTIVLWSTPSATATSATAAASESPNHRAPVVLFFHGNGENLATLHLSGLFDELSALGVTVLAPDYPGYGRSTGRPTEPALAATADATLAHATESYPGRPIVACGWSLGAAVAVGLADRHPDRLTALIALSPWASLDELARRFFPGPLVSLALTDHYDSMSRAPEIHLPTLMIHGARDAIIPAEHGRRLAAALAGPVEHVELAHAGHNDLLAHPEVWREIERFLEAIED